MKHDDVGWLIGGLFHLFAGFILLFSAIFGFGMLEEYDKQFLIAIFGLYLIVVSLMFFVMLEWGSVVDD